METDLILKFKQNLFSKVIWSSTFNKSMSKNKMKVGICIFVFRYSNLFRYSIYSMSLFGQKKTNSVRMNMHACMEQNHCALTCLRAEL